MIQGWPITSEPVQSGGEVFREQPLSPTPIDSILQKPSYMEFPVKEHFERYMRHKWRLNHEPRTLASSFTSAVLFLEFYGKLGKREIEKIDRVDAEGFIEHEQDLGLRISTVRTRLACIIIFLHFLMERDVIPGLVLKRSVKLKLQDVLPRAINSSDVKKFLSVIGDIGDRSLILLLFFTGLRVGEALGVRVDSYLQGGEKHDGEGKKDKLESNKNLLPEVLVHDNFLKLPLGFVNFLRFGLLD